MFDSQTIDKIFFNPVFSIFSFCKLNKPKPKPIKEEYTHLDTAIKELAKSGFFELDYSDYSDYSDFSDHSNHHSTSRMMNTHWRLK